MTIHYRDGTTRREWDCPSDGTELIWVDDMTGYQCPKCFVYVCRTRRPTPEGGEQP